MNRMRLCIPALVLLTALALTTTQPTEIYPPILPGVAWLSDNTPLGSTDVPEEVSSSFWA